MSSSGIDLAFRFVAPTLVLVCLGQLWRRGLVRPYPAFTAYLAFQLAGMVILYPLYLAQVNDNDWYPKYFVAFWLSEAFSLFLISVIFLRVFRYSFEPYRLLRRFSTVLYLGILAVLLVIALGAAAHAPASDKYSLTHALLSFKHSMELLRTGIMLAFFALVWFLALPLRSLTVGIALGFGLEAAVSVAATSLRQYAGGSFSGAYATVSAFAYVLALVVFTAYLVAPWRELQISSVPTRDTLDRWNDALREFIHRT